MLDVGIVMHADIAIAPRLHKIMAAIRAIRVMLINHIPAPKFRKQAQSASAARQSALNLRELGWRPRTVLALALRGERSDGARFSI